MKVFLAFHEEPDTVLNNYNERVLRYEDRSERLKFTVSLMGVGKTLEMAVSLIGFHMWEWLNYDLNEESPDHTNQAMLDEVDSGEYDRYCQLLHNTSDPAEYKLVWYHAVHTSGNPEHPRSEYKYYVLEVPLVGPKGLDRVRHKMWPHDPYGENNTKTVTKGA